MTERLVPIPPDFAAAANVVARQRGDALAHDVSRTCV